MLAEHIRARMCVRMSGASSPPVRQRRRQLYHAKAKVKPVAENEQNKRRASAKPRATKDNGQFRKQLRPPRTLQTIEAKLKVLDYYEGLLKEKRKAAQVLCAPKQSARTRESKASLAEQRKQAKDVKARNLQRLCEEKFPLTVKKSMVCRWLKASKREAWRDLPSLLRSRMCATTNAWRVRLGLQAKGRTKGGAYPCDLQRELDWLVYEHANGLSSVSARHEVVTIEHVAF